MRKDSLKFQFLFFTLIIIICMSLINVYTLLSSKRIECKYKDMIDKMIEIDYIGKNVEESVFYLDKYFSTKACIDYEEYIKFYDLATDRAINLKNHLDLDSEYVLRDLKNQLLSYRKQSKLAIEKFYKYNKTDKFYTDFQEAKVIANYCEEYVYKLHHAYLNYNSSEYKKLNKIKRTENIVSMVLLIVITLNCISMIIVFFADITKCINNLVTSAKEISKGKFNIINVDKCGIYEIDLLSSKFNIMAKELKKLIFTMKKNNILEKRLKNQAMKNLQTENMLKESKLKLLQSQINPHFLFNTLNCITQTSIIEEAYETERLINSIGKLLRYSLNMVDSETFLKNEIYIIQQYVYIQETRFGDRIKFNINVDKDLNNLRLPGMCLQPIVENAFIHGIESKEEGGSININVYKKEGDCIIEINDDGKGMDECRIKDILKEDINSNHKGHTTGIGIKNVINRLKLFYNGNVDFYIHSKKGIGTKVFIRIRGDKYVEDIGS